MIKEQRPPRNKITPKNVRVFMYVGIYVCMYECMYVRVCVCVCVYIYIYIYIYINIYETILQVTWAIFVSNVNYGTSRRSCLLSLYPKIT